MNNVQTFVLFAFVLLIIIAAVRVWITKHLNRSKGATVTGYAVEYHKYEDSFPITNPYASKRKIAAIHAAPVAGTKYPRTRSMTREESEARARLGASEFWRRFEKGGHYES